METKKQPPEASRDPNWRTPRRTGSVFDSIGPAARQGDETSFQHTERRKREKRMLKASLRGHYLVVHKKKADVK